MRNVFADLLLVFNHSLVLAAMADRAAILLARRRGWLLARRGRLGLALARLPNDILNDMLVDPFDRARLGLRWLPLGLVRDLVVVVHLPLPVDPFPVARERLALVVWRSPRRISFAVILSRRRSTLSVVVVTRRAWRPIPSPVVAGMLIRARLVLTVFVRTIGIGPLIQSIMVGPGLVDAVGIRAVVAGPILMGACLVAWLVRAVDVLGVG